MVDNIQFHIYPNPTSREYNINSYFNLLTTWFLFKTELFNIIKF